MSDPTGATPKSGEPSLCLLTSLVIRQVPVSEDIFFLGLGERRDHARPQPFYRFY